VRRFTILAVLLCFVVGIAQADTVYKRKIAKEDIKAWNGKDETFEARDSMGRRIALTPIDYVGVDVEEVYGSQTGSAIQAAVSAVGTTNKVALWLSPGTWTLGANLTTASNITLRPAPGAMITLGAYDLTINGPLEAGLRQIFNEDSTGAVTLGATSVSEVHPEWWGADNTGATTCDAAWESAIEAIAAVGGKIVGAGAYAHYDFDDEILIDDDNITIDGNWALATFTNADRFIAQGTPTADGDWDNNIKNFTIRNWRMGEGAGDTTKGPRCYWADNCLVENISIDSESSTKFNMYMCRGCLFRNLYMTRSKNDTDKHVGILSWLSMNSVIENCHVYDTTGLAYFIQLKGGYDNKVVNCSARNIDKGNYAAAKHLFRDRGSNPDAAESCGGSCAGIYYPFATGAWATADEQRNNHNSQFIGCSVHDAPDHHGFYSGESIGTQIVGFSCYQVSTCIIATNSSGDDEKDLIIANGRIEDGGLFGIAVGGESGDQYEGIQISNVTIDTVDYSGIAAVYTDDLQISNVYVRNPNDADNNTDYGSECGIVVENSNDTMLTNIRVVDDRGAPQMERGVYISGASTTNPILSNIHVEGANDTHAGAIASEQVTSWFLGKYSNIYPGPAYAPATAADPETTFWRLEALPNSTIVHIKAVVTGYEDGGTDRAKYTVDALINVAADGTTTTLDGGVTADYEDDANWDLAFSYPVAGNGARLQPTGNGDTVNWIMTDLDLSWIAP